MYLCMRSRFIPEGVAEASKISRDTQIYPKIALTNSTIVIGGKPIAVNLRCECC
jgi:hypothetical protein